MIGANKQDFIGTLKITGVTQNVSLLPLVVPVNNTDKKHGCNYENLQNDHHQSLSVLYLSEQDISTKIPRIADRFDQVPQRYPGIDENITTMVQMTSERDTCTDDGKNWTDEEKLRLNQSCEQMKEEEKGVINTIALIDESSTLSFRINKVPFIEISGLTMASWTDVKELLFPRCSDPNCCVVLHCLIKKFAYPSNLRLMHPCTDKEEGLFLRQFKLVFRGCILISLPEVEKHMLELQDAVERIHHNRPKTNDICCKYQDAKFSRCPSQRPKTSNPRQRSIFARRPKSAIETTTTSESRQKSQRFTILPILHLPDNIQEIMATSISSLGPEVDAEDCHLPVLISTGDGNLTVPCSVLTRVFPQTYNVVIDSLTTQYTPTNQNQIPHKTKDDTLQKQIIYSACSTLQAAAFNRWILKYAGCTMKAVTTGGLTINLRCFSMLTNGILPLETRKVLQATCQWQKEEDVCPTNDLPVQKNVNENVENDVHVEEYNVSDDSAVDPSVRASDLFDSNHNAGELQDETEDQPQDIDVVPQDNEMQCVGNNVYQSDDRQQFCSTYAQRKGQLRDKRASPRVNTTTVSITTQGGKSSFSVTTSQISSKKVPRQKSARKGSKLGHAKSPYLVQSALLSHGRVVKHCKRTPSSANSADVRSENEMDISSRPRCHMSANISNKLELWPKAFIAKPPSVLRVNSPPKDSRVSSPRNPQFHPTCTVDHSGFEPCSRQAKQKTMEHSLTVNSNSLEKRNLLRMRVTGSVCPERYKGKPNLKLGRQMRNQISSDSVCGKDILHSYSSSFEGTDMKHPSLVSLSENCQHEHLQSDSLKMAVVHTLEQQPIKIPSENDYSEDENTQSKHIGDEGKLSTVEEEVLTPTSPKSDVIQASMKPGIYQPIPPWKMYNLQLNDHHPYTDIYKMYSFPPPSPTVHQKKDRDGLEAWDLNCGDGSMSASSSTYTTTSSCSIKLNQESNQLHDLSSSTESGLQGTNKDIPSPETSIQEVKNSPTDSRSCSSSSSEEVKTSVTLDSEDDTSTVHLTEPFPLKVVGLINALQTLRVSAPRNPLIGNLLRENITPKSHVDTGVISITSDLIKPNNLQHQKDAHCSSSLASSDTTVHSDDCADLTVLQQQSATSIQLSSGSDQRCVDLCDNSSISEDIKCTTAQTNAFITTENSNEENISGDEGEIHSDHIEITRPNLIKLSPKTSKVHSGAIRPAAYKGSALILAECTPECNKLQEFLSRQKILDGMKSLITPDLLNISRFKSVGNVMLTKQKVNVTSEKSQNKLTVSAIGGKENDGVTLVVSKSKQQQQHGHIPEKRLEHIKINSSIELRRQRSSANNQSELVNKYTDTDLTKNTDDVINSNDTTVRPIRMQYDVTSTRPTGTGRFQHHRRTSPIMVRKGLNVKQNAPVANNHFSSYKEGCNKIHDSEELFQGMVTNSSIRYKALSRAQDYIAKIISDTCYQIPSSSPSISYRLSQQPVCNTQSCDGSKGVSCTQSTESIPYLNTNGVCSTPRHRRNQCVRDDQYCVECLEKRQKPVFKYTCRTPGLHIPQQFNSMNPEYMAPNSPLQKYPTPGTRDEEECCSVYHVHDSISNPLHASKYRRISNVNTDLPKRNLAAMSIENINKLEDNISIISPNEHCSNTVKSSTGQKNSGATGPNEQPKLSSKTNNKTTNRQEATTTSKVNVVFEYKNQPENRMSTPSLSTKFIGTKFRGQSENTRVGSVPKGYHKICDSRHSKQARHLTGNIKRKLRICIDLVGSSEEDSPLEVIKLESKCVDSTNVSK